MVIFQHIKFCTRIFILLLLLFVIILYFTSTAKDHEFSPNPLEVTKLLIPVTIPNKKISSTNKLKTQNINLSSKTVFENQNNSIFKYGNFNSNVTLAVVLCGPRLNQTVVTLKSAVILSKTSLHFIIISDKENKEKIQNELLNWPSQVLNRLSFEIQPITFPNGTDGEEWKKLFKLCACQRLFLPSLLSHIDSVIYVDTDVLFMHPVEDLWKLFYKMNASQIAGLAPEHEDFATGWYNRFARHPYYEPLGVNSGVMLMNLTRMRSFQWETYLQPIMKEYRLKIVWGDQDIINIIFHFHSDKLFIFPCEWNYRPDHCMYSSVCKTAEKNGALVIHGNRGVFQNNKQPVFKAIYESVANYEIGKNLTSGLLEPVKNLMKETATTNCGKSSNVLIKSLQNFIKNTEKASHR